MKGGIVKGMKSVTALGIGLAVSLATVQPAAATEAPQTVNTAHTSSEILDASARAAAAMQDFGIAPGNYIHVDQADAAFFDEVADLALADMAEPTPAPGTACTPGGRAAYAAQIAAVNSARDSNARTPAQETMYMYLSHYIDMSPSHVGTTCNHNSEAPRYSAWITSSDRNAYDQFLATMNLTSAVTTFGDAVSAAGVLQGSPNLTRNISKVADAAAFLTEAADFTFSANAALGLADQLVVSHQNGDTAEQAIADLEASLSPDMPTTYAAAATGVAAALLAPSIVLPVVGIGLAVLPVYTMLGATIINYAAWSSLIYTSNSRVSGRMMRYLGM
ncbi:hypothetical protein C2138_06060 [Salinibacterium hongtaonis]|nr:hypothetical protein C2138_06060 [Salinibacterium hongtaonis]